MSGPFQSPFTPAFDTPSGEGSGVSQRGGYDLGEGGRKESANSESGLPTQPDIYTLEGAPGAGDQVPLGNIGTDRTIETRKD